MCMPTNFSNRKKHYSSFKRDKKKILKKDNFFKDADKFLEEKNESSSFKS